ncbi:chromate transporter [Anaerosalibacter bizertensis]|uniref:Chromate transporter n=1 Tax=Anaerosalibacter bizertensis TaxID=932217 RepID=A0A9Q4FMC3_9FIRM|nr:chromate transporter [Anaerosalibacter bizertensis]MCB5559753.1 chromate transporter [Anaerosalibacter bizertensis]MCG4565554.1 chromate transporter [Anaerosalibacter bizertensis]MCG4582648.1 chromate transporter [Anaerosalibacter bizertensis]MCG4583947.1 chromate transporter [Anaerosalibacter bizertensis]
MELLNLFLSFLKIGAFTFGGGYAMIPLIEKEAVEIHGWLTTKEFIDILAVVEMTPGPIAINSATFLGYKVGGVLGSVLATTAVVLPSIIVIILIAHFLWKFKNSPYVDWAFKGIRPVVLGLIVSASISVAKNAFIDFKSVIIGGVLFYLISFKKLHPILAIILAGVAGVLVY